MSAKTFEFYFTTYKAASKTIPCIHVQQAKHLFIFLLHLWPPAHSSTLAILQTTVHQGTLEHLCAPLWTGQLQRASLLLLLAS